METMHGTNRSKSVRGVLGVNRITKTSKVLIMMPYVVAFCIMIFVAFFYEPAWLF